ncbi:MAG: site-specific integrase [Bryobacteraceae bacterium]
MKLFVSTCPFPGDRPGLLRFLSQYKNPRTRHQIYRSVKTFIRWAARRALCTDYISDLRIHFPEAAPKPVVTPSDFRRIMKSIPDTLAGRRDRVIYKVLYFTGARRDAIRLLQWDSVDLTEPSIQFVTKGRQEQDVPIPGEAAAALKAWRRECPSRIYVFPSITHPKRPICPDAVTRRLPEYAKDAGLGRRVNVHRLRHSFVVRMADAGVPYETIALATGHRSTDMVAHYDRRNPARLKAVYERVFH